MATIKTFEDVESWKLARKLCKKTGELIDSGRFKKSFRLIDQIDGSSGSVINQKLPEHEKTLNLKHSTLNSEK